MIGARSLIGGGEELAKHLAPRLRREFSQAKHVGATTAALGLEALGEGGNAAITGVEFDALDG